MVKMAFDRHIVEHPDTPSDQDVEWQGAGDDCRDATDDRAAGRDRVVVSRTAFGKARLGTAEGDTSYTSAEPCEVAQVHVERAGDAGHALREGR